MIPPGELRALAEMATPGGWAYEDANWVRQAPSRVVASCETCGKPTEWRSDGEDEPLEYGTVRDGDGRAILQSVESRHNARFIAAASPDVVLSLLDRNEELEAEDAILAALAEHGWIVIPVEPSDAMVETATQVLIDAPRLNSGTVHRCLTAALSVGARVSAGDETR